MSRDDRPGFTSGDSVASGAMENRRVGFIGPRLPTRLSCRLLSCSLEAPDEIDAGVPTPFRFHVKNRAPTSLTLECASARSWGWTVDDVPEAGVGRFEPPTEPATVAFGPRERRTFVGRWDGQFLEADGSRERWVTVPGTHTLTAYIAVEDWRTRGMVASVDVTVRT